MNATDAKLFYNQAQETGTPVFLYDTSVIAEQVRRIGALRMPFGQTIRYAMKANPHPDIVSYIYKNGVHIDASSSYEASAAIKMGVTAEDILLTSQQSAHDMDEIISRGVAYNATSLQQLKQYGEHARGGTVSVRINPGIGSGHSKKADVGGVTSSFGIWHEYIDEALAIADAYKLKIERVHTHIGSGSDPNIWEDAVDRTLHIVARFPSSATTVNFGGGFKVARTEDEKETPIELVGEIINKKVMQFYTSRGRKLHVELEPGTFFVANAGTLVARVDDMVDTGPDGYRFIKLDTGMNDILRPTLYGAQHPISVINPSRAGESGEFVVVGHNCESGDILTVAANDPEEIRPKKLDGVEVGSFVAIGGTGAYCASMSAHGYNNFPSAKERIV